MNKKDLNGLFFLQLDLINSAKLLSLAKDNGLEGIEICASSIRVFEKVGDIWRIFLLSKL